MVKVVYLNLARKRSFLKPAKRSLSSYPDVSKESIYANYEGVKKFAVENPAQFWEQIASSRLQWRKKFTRGFNGDMSKGEIKWFEDGVLNASENCLDRHDDNNVAIIWEKDEPKQEERLTYRELRQLTCRVANVMKGIGVTKGDRVAIYMPNSPMAAAVMLACARIGAIHCVVFAGFSAQSLQQRINDASAKLVVTSDQAVRGGKVIDLKAIVNEAVKDTPSIEHVLVWKRTGASVASTKLDVCLDTHLEQVEDNCEVEQMGAEDYLFMLYTSGSTGKPKGLMHSTGGYLAYAAYTHETVFDYNPGDIHACVADIGWITGHTYGLYGPLANGATTVLFESIPTYPDPGRYWEMVERLKVNQLYTAPTAIRLLLKSGDSHVTKYDLSSLKTIGSVGEPINNEAWEWYHRVVGNSRCTVVDTWWQTETGGILISPRPAPRDSEIVPTMAMRALPGIQPTLLHPNTGQVVESKAVSEGALCIAKPWPGMARTIWNAQERFFDTYFSTFPGYYFSGDEATRDERGYYRITGRMDDVINVSGHRLGTSEVEDAINEHPEVAESAVIGVAHDIKGEGIHAYVILKDSSQGTEQEIMKGINQLVKKQIASFAIPDRITITPALPKTRSGKIMRRILRKLSAGITDDLGDITTLADPSVVEQLIKATKTSR